MLRMIELESWLWIVLATDVGASSWQWGQRSWRFVRLIYYFLLPEQQLMLVFPWLIFLSESFYKTFACIHSTYRIKNIECYHLIGSKYKHFHFFQMFSIWYIPYPGNFSLFRQRQNAWELKFLLLLEIVFGTLLFWSPRLDFISVQTCQHYVFYPLALPFQRSVTSTHSKIVKLEQ